VIRFRLKPLISECDGALFKSKLKFNYMYTGETPDEILKSALSQAFPGCNPKGTIEKKGKVVVVVKEIDHKALPHLFYMSEQGIHPLIKRSATNISIHFTPGLI
jgi:hypothetical protein